MVVLAMSSLGLHFSKEFLADLKTTLGLLKYFVFFFIFHICLPNILLKFLEHFSHTISHLILAQIFAPFEYLLFPWRNFSFIFSVIGLNSGLKFSCKALSLYLTQEILIFLCEELFLEKYRTCFFYCRILYISTNHLWKKGHF